MRDLNDAPGAGAGPRLARSRGTERGSPNAIRLFLSRRRSAASSYNASTATPAESEVASPASRSRAALVANDLRAAGSRAAMASVIVRALAPLAAASADTPSRTAASSAASTGRAAAATGAARAASLQKHPGCVGHLLKRSACIILSVQLGSTAHARMCRCWYGCCWRCRLGVRVDALVVRRALQCCESQRCYSGQRIDARRDVSQSAVFKLLLLAAWCVGFTTLPFANSCCA